jgi:hypothetical protein
MRAQMSPLSCLSQAGQIIIWKAFDSQQAETRQWQE